MDDFNSFVNNNSEEINGMNKDLVSLVTGLANKYNNASEEDLLKAIYAEAEKGRKNGTLKDSDIDRFAAVLSPLLDDKKRKKLQYVIQKLKKT